MKHIAFLAVLLVAGCSSPPPTPPDAALPAPAAAAPAAVQNSRTSFSMEQYSQLKLGMTYEEAVKIMGNTGVQDKNGSSYTWKNKDGSYANAGFKDGHVTFLNYLNLPATAKEDSAGPATPSTKAPQ